MSRGGVIMEVTQADLRAFGHTLHLWRTQFGKSAQEVVRKQARLVAVNCAHNTQPYGFGPNARQAGERAVARDINRVYVAMTSIFATIEAKDPDAAKGFVKAIKKGDHARAREIMRAFGLAGIADLPFGAFDSAVHDQLRFGNRRGRVPNGTKPKLIVTDPRILAAYKRRMNKRVGYGKSAWASCADQLGGARGIPQWAKRHRAPARVRDFSGDLLNPRVEMTSLVRFADTILPAAMQQDALEKQRAKMQKEIEIALLKSAQTSRAAVAA